MFDVLLFDVLVSLWKLRRDMMRMMGNAHLFDLQDLVNVHNGQQDGASNQEDEVAQQALVAVGFGSTLLLLQPFRQGPGMSLSAE